MRTSVWLLAAIAIALAGVLAPSAPVRAQETQVAFDREGRFLTVDLRTARRLGVFADTTRGFQEARLFRLADYSFVLERTSLRDGRLVRERTPLTAREVEALRERFAVLATERHIEGALNQEGRLPLVLGTTLLGLGYYGWALPASLDLGSDEKAAGVYLVTASASFFLPWLATARSPVTYATSNLALYGATRGILHGMMLANVDSDARGDEDVSELSWSVGTSVVEAALGYVWASRQGLTNGEATAITVFGDLGMIEAGCAAQLSGAFNDGRTSGGSAAVVCGGIAGMLGGRLIASRRDYTFGDASVMRTTGMLGTWAGLTAASGLDADTDKAWAGAVMAGSALGVAVGDRLVAGRSFAVAPAVTVQLGTMAGGLFGLGVSYIAAGEDAPGTAYMVGSLAGAVGGYAITYRLLASDAARAAVVRTAWNAELEPATLIAPGHDGRARLVPALALRARF